MVRNLAAIGATFMNPKHHKMFPREVKLDPCPRCGQNTVMPLDTRDIRFCLRKECDWTENLPPLEEDEAMTQSLTIIINGNTFMALEGEMSYEKVLELSKRTGDRTWTMTYSHWKRKGQLLPGASVTLEQGMIFNVADTCMS